MDTQGTINSDFGAMEDEQRRLASFNRTIEDPDGPSPDLTYQGLTFLQRIYDSQQDQMNGKMNPPSMAQFRFHRRALKIRYKAWKRISSQLPPQYLSGLQNIQLNNPELFANSQEMIDCCMLLGAEQMLNSHKAENRPLSWHLDEKTVAGLDVLKAETAYMENVTTFHHTCARIMGQLDDMSNIIVHEECKIDAINSLMNLADTMSLADQGRGKLYFKILEEFVGKEAVLSHQNRVRQRNFYHRHREKGGEFTPLKLVETA